MDLPRVLAVGKFYPEDLRVSVSESTRKIDAAIESQLEDVWEKKVRFAAKTGRTLYNGISYRLNYIRQEGATLFLDFGTLEFKVRDGLIGIPEYFELSEEYYRKGCFTSATVKTADGKYLIVELSGKSMNPNKTETLGGIMETTIGMESGSDVFKSNYAELEEEGCIKESEIKDSYLRAIYLEAKTNIGFYMEITLSISSTELLERFKNEGADTEIKSLLAFSKEEYIQHLKDHSSPNKQLTAELLDI